MPKNTKTYVLAGLAGLLVVAVAGFWALNRSASGIPAFYVWKTFSSAAHGGERAELNGISLYYETFGDPDAPPVLVLHGGTGFIESMHYQITALAPAHFVVAPDSRAHGRSTDTDAPLGYRQMADDMLALMDRLGIERADIVGWSDGGIIGLILAMENPDRVRRVVAIGANYNVAGLASPPPADASVISASPARDFYVNMAPEPSRWPVFAAKVLEMWRTQPNYEAADLAKIAAPVLVMAGERDSIKRSHTEEMAASIPLGRLDIVEDASHFAPLEKPDRVNAAVLSFLSE
ncbi:MAG: alpha/beta hydrolase [Parvibaculum sp.]